MEKSLESQCISIWWRPEVTTINRFRSWKEKLSMMQGECEQSESHLSLSASKFMIQVTVPQHLTQDMEKTDEIRRNLGELQAQLLPHTNKLSHQTSRNVSELPWGTYLNGCCFALEVEISCEFLLGQNKTHNHTGEGILGSAAPV